MNIDEAPEVFEALLKLWEHALRREDTLRLILNDCCPDWNHHYLRYWETPGIEEHAFLVTVPFRRVVDATVRGELTRSLLEQALEEVQKKSN